jgi:hypothetical protein
MNKNNRTWLWLSAIVSFAGGFILVLNDSGAGWFLIIMGMVYIGSLTRPVQTWAEVNLRTMQRALVGITILFVVIVSVAVLLLTKRLRFVPRKSFFENYTVKYLRRTFENDRYSWF